MKKAFDRELKLRQLAGDAWGVIVDTENSYIYRLCVAPDGRYRVALNKFDVTENTVLGPAVQTWNFKVPGDAIDYFNYLKNLSGKVWREDDRVFYQPNCNA